MDDPALLKAALLDQPLHRRIAGVGIDADIGGNAFAMLGGALEQPVANTPCMPVSSYITLQTFF